MMMTSWTEVSAVDIEASLCACPTQQEQSNQQQDHAKEQVSGPDASMKYRDIKQSCEADAASDQDDQGDRCDEKPNGDRPYADKQRPDRPGGDGIYELMGPFC